MPQWAGRPQLLVKYLKVTGDYLSVFSVVMVKPIWARHPQVLKFILDNITSGISPTGLMEMFTHNGMWYSMPEFVLYALKFKMHKTVRVEEFDPGPYLRSIGVNSHRFNFEPFLKMSQAELSAYIDAKYPLSKLP